MKAGSMLALSLFSGLCGRAARADDAPSGALEIVVTGTRTPESTQRATVRAEVVSREEAERRGARNVGEAIAGQLGVQVNPGAYGYLGGPSAIQIQGMDLERVLILEDGERVIGDVGGAIDLSKLPLTDVSRIEIVTGPTSSLYGTGAIGGVVNILTRPPSAEGASARLRFEGRTLPSLLGEASGAYRRGDSWAEVDTSILRQRGQTLGAAPDQLVLPDLTEHMIGFRAGARISDHATIQVRARWVHDGSEGHEDQLFPGLGTYRVDTPERTDRIALFGSETIDLGRRTNLRLSVGKQWTFDASMTDRVSSPLDQVQDARDTLSSFEAIATIADGPRTWVAGARFEAEALHQELRQTTLDGTRLVDTTTPEVPGMTLGSAALYTQLEMKLGDRLTLLPGVRAEEHVRYGGVVAPRLALAFRPAEGWTLRAGGGRGFRAPSAKEFGFDFDHAIYGYRVLGNPDLVPETSWGVNADVTYVPVRGLTIRVGGFANWIDDLIDFQLSPTRTVPGVDDYIYANIGKARTMGLQVDASCDPASWLRTEAGYAYLWTRDDANERPLQGRPAHTAYASVRATLPLDVELVLRFRTVSAAFVDVDLTTPGFSTLDGRVAHALWPRSKAYVGMTNALDVQKDPKNPGDERPLYGRVAYAGLTAELPWEERP